jgi:hypothetical protein
MKIPAAMRRQKNAIVVRCLGFIVVLLDYGETTRWSSVGETRGEYMKTSCAVRR